MNDSDRKDGGITEKQDRRELLRSAYEAVDRLQSRLEAVERERTEPVAVIGMSCRFPGGAASPDAYWKLLKDGVYAVREVPAERWDRRAYARLDPEAASRMPPQYGGFLEDVDLFDPRFFGIAPRETATMDPQQRLVLEVSWEALESAGYAPDRLAGSRTGVFIGMTTSDYSQVIREADPTRLDVYFATGNAHNAAAGRVSYVLGLRGPAMAVDTACSSSLTAIHMACRSLRAGDCTMALVGGVNLILVPDPFVCFAKWGMMAPDGRCKAFDEDADGFVRSEGCGMLVLKPLSAARADRDTILAIIRGSAVNQDGASGGLTVPNGLAQQDVIRRALADARLSAADIDYVETHGTGTSLGDPIELEAIDAVLGEGRPKGRPLVVGSVKTNIGHLESASGVAGLIKTILCLQNGEIPPHLHFRRLNPRITLKRLDVIVPTERRAWPGGGTPRRAGVSSFGFSGTNVHVVVEEPPVEDAADAGTIRRFNVLTLSAKSDTALRTLARRYSDKLSGDRQPAWQDACYTSNIGRSHFPHRMSVVADSSRDAAARLAAAAEGAYAPNVFVGRTEAGVRPRVAFLFSGQGAQYAGMARALFETEQVFRQAIERCDALLRGHLDRSLLDVLYPQKGSSSPIDETGYTQPALFALEYALAELWRSWGVVPDVVLGHSVGEYAAACVAGVFGLEDGLALIAARASLMNSLPRAGAMAAVFAEKSRVEENVAEYRDRISIAAVNAPDNVVISGHEETVAAVLAGFKRQGIGSRRLAVSHAFHSPLMEPVLDRFEEIASRLSFHAPSIPIISNITGDVADAEEITKPSYWRKHVRAAVLFEDGVRSAASRNTRIFVEIGPAATLLGLGKRSVPENVIAWIPTLRKDGSDARCTFEALARLHVEGVAIDWEAVHRGLGGRRTALPTYPFERERHWITAGSAPKRERIASDDEPALHPFYDRHITLAGERDTHVFEGELSLERLPYLGDHRVQDRPVVPATAFSEMALAARRIAFGDGPVALVDVEYLSPILLGNDRNVRVQVKVRKDGEEYVEFVVSGRATAPVPEAAWKTHAKGRLRSVAEHATRVTEADIELLKSRCIDTIEGAEFYRLLAERGNQWGPAFQGVERIWRGAGEVLGLVSVPEALRGHEARYVFHPAIADACGHPMVATIPLERSGERRGGAFVGGRIDEARIYAPPRGNRFWVHARLREGEGERSNVLVGDLRLMDADLNVVSELRGARLWYLDDASSSGAADGWIYTVRFEESKESSGEGRTGFGAGTWIVLADRGGQGEALAGAIEAAGGQARVFLRGDDPEDGKVEADLAALSGDDARCRGVVYLRALDGRLGKEEADRNPGKAFEAGLEDALGIIKAVAGKRVSGPMPLWIVTCGAHRVSGDDPPPDPAQTALWGLARTLAAEQPESWGAVIDLDPRETKEKSAAMLSGMLHRHDGEDQLALRGNRCFVARLARTTLSPVSRRFDWRPDATYVVTGGMGGLGLRLSEWLVGKGVRHLTLIGRTAMPARDLWDTGDVPPQIRDRIEAVRRLERAGATVRLVSADIGDEDSMTACLRDLETEGPEVKGIIHAAGVMRHEALLETSAADFRETIRAKSIGAWILHRWASARNLDCFVLFSSASSVLNSPFVGGYAAANAFLDGLAHRRAAHGLPALSVNWGLWGGVGMARGLSEKDIELVKERGMGSIPVDLGFDLFGILVHQEDPQIGVIPVDWEKWKHLFPAFVENPFFSGIVRSTEKDREGPGFLKRDEIANATGEERLRLLRDRIRRHAADVLGLGAETLDEDSSINRLGLDSLMATELRGRIEADTGVSLPLVRLLEGPTVRELAVSLAELVETAAEGSRAKAVSGGIGGEARDGIKGAVDAGKILEGLDNLSDAEVDRLLKEMLASGETPK